MSETATMAECRIKPRSCQEGADRDKETRLSLSMSTLHVNDGDHISGMKRDETSSCKGRVAGLSRR